MVQSSGRVMAAEEEEVVDMTQRALLGYETRVCS